MKEVAILPATIHSAFDSRYFASVKVGSFSQILFIIFFTSASHGLPANGKRSATVSALLPYHTPISNKMGVNV